MQKSYLFIVIALIVFSLCHCHKKADPDIVARWRDINISDSEFARSYFDFWATTHEPDSPSLRRKYARQLIEQKLIVKNHPLKDPSQIERAVARDHARFLRRRYLEKIIGEKIPFPSEEKLKKALALRQRRLFVRQIWSTDEERIRSLMAEIDAGASFDEVAIKAAAGGSRDYGSGTLGWIGWGDTDLPVETVLFQMQEGEVSKPIPSLMGWHIFCIDSIKIQMRFGTISALEVKEVRQRLRDRHFDMAVAEHLRGLIWQKSLKVNVKILAAIWEVMAPQLPTSTQPWAIRPLERWRELPTPDFARQVVAQVDGQDFTVGEFFDALPELPRHLLRPNLKKALEIAIRDKILTQEALKLGLDRDAVVIEKTQHSRTTYAYYAIMAAAMDSAASPQEAHQRLLPPQYQPEEVVYHNEVMQRALMSTKIID